MKKRMGLIFVILFILILLPVLGAKGKINTCKRVQIVVKNNSDKPILVTGLRYRDYDRKYVSYRGESFSAKIIKKNSQKTWKRNLEYVGNETTYILVAIRRPKKFKFGEWKFMTEPTRYYSNKFKCKNNCRVVINYPKDSVNPDSGGR